MRAQLTRGAVDTRVLGSRAGFPKLAITLGSARVAGTPAARSGGQTAEATRRRNLLLRASTPRPPGAPAGRGSGRRPHFRGGAGRGQRAPRPRARRRSIPRPSPPVCPCPSVRPERATAASAGRGCPRVQCARHRPAQEGAGRGPGSRAGQGEVSGRAGPGDWIPACSRRRRPHPRRGQPPRGPQFPCPLRTGPRCPHPASWDGWHQWLWFLCASPQSAFPAARGRGGGAQRDPCVGERVLAGRWLLGGMVGAGDQRWLHADLLPR